MMNAKFISALFFGSLAFFLQPARARTVSEFQLFAPKTTLNRQILNKNFNLQLHLDNWSVQSPVQINAQDVQIGLHGSISSLDLGTGFIRLKILLNSIDLQSRHLEFKQEYTTSGSLIGRFLLQAKCQNLSLQLNAHTSFIDSTLNFDQVGRQLSSSASHLQLENPKIIKSAMNCQGPKGFEQTLNDQILNFAFQLPQLIESNQNMILSELNLALSEQFNQFIQLQQVEQLKNQIQINQKIQSLFFQNDGVWVNGFLNFSFSPLDYSIEEPKWIRFAQNQILSPSSHEKPILFLPPDTFGLLLTDKFKSNSWKIELTHAQMPGFQKLMRSSWLKFLLWPDLFKFNKKTSFLFQFYSDQNIQVSMDSPLDSSLQNYKVIWPIRLQMYNLNQNQWDPYVHFSIQYNTQLTPHLSDYGFGYSTQNTKLKLINDSDLPIGLSLLQKEVQKVLSSQMWSGELLRFLNFQPTALYSNPQALQIELSEK